MFSESNLIGIAVFDEWDDNDYHDEFEIIMGHHFRHFLRRKYFDDE